MIASWVGSAGPVRRPRQLGAVFAVPRTADQRLRAFRTNPPSVVATRAAGFEVSRGERIRTLAHEFTEYAEQRSRGALPAEVRHPLPASVDQRLPMCVRRQPLFHGGRDGFDLEGIRVENRIFGGLTEDRDIRCDDGNITTHRFEEGMSESLETRGEYEERGVSVILSDLLMDHGANEMDLLREISSRFLSLDHLLLVFRVLIITDYERAEPTPRSDARSSCIDRSS